MSRRCSDHLPQHSCSQTLLEQSWTALGTNSCSLHTYISHDLHGLPVSQSRWTSRGWILPEKFLKVWHVPPKRGASPHKNLPADKVLWKSLLLHCFPRPHFHSWTRYLHGTSPPYSTRYLHGTSPLLLVHTWQTKPTDYSACAFTCNPAAKWHPNLLNLKSTRPVSSPGEV